MRFCNSESHKPLGRVESRVASQDNDCILRDRHILTLKTKVGHWFGDKFHVPIVPLHVSFCLSFAGTGQSGLQHELSSFLFFPLDFICSRCQRRHFLCLLPGRSKRTVGNMSRCVLVRFHEIQKVLVWFSRLTKHDISQNLLWLCLGHSKPPFLSPQHSVLCLFDKFTIIE